MSTPPDQPSIGFLISTHTLAASIISSQPTSHPFLDAAELAILKRFCLDPSARDAILAENDFVDGPGQRAGSRALEKGGSLVGLIIARHGTGKPALSGEEMEVLREWFEDGGGA